MKTYFIKYNQPYSEQDSDVLEKDCVEIEDKFLPVRINWGEFVGRTKIFSDEIGVYVEETKYQQDKIKIDFTKDLKIDFGFLIGESEIKNNIRHIKKIELKELSIRQ